MQSQYVFELSNYPPKCLILGIKGLDDRKHMFSPCELNITVTPWGNFLESGLRIDLEWKWFDFRWSEVRFHSQWPHILVNAISKECPGYFNNIWHSYSLGLSDELTWILWPEVKVQDHCGLTKHILGRKSLIQMCLIAWSIILTQCCNVRLVFASCFFFLSFSFHRQSLSQFLIASVVADFFNYN